MVVVPYVRLSLLIRKSRQTITKPALPCLLPRHIPPKELRFHPIQHNQHPVPSAEAHAQVCRLPEQICHRSTRRDVAALKPRHVCDGLLSADVSQRSLVRVLKGTDLLDAAEPVGVLVYIKNDGDAWTYCFCLSLISSRIISRSSFFAVDCLALSSFISSSIASVLAIVLNSRARKAPS